MTNHAFNAHPASGRSVDARPDPVQSGPVRRVLGPWASLLGPLVLSCGGAPPAPVAPADAGPSWEVRARRFVEDTRDDREPCASLLGAPTTDLVLRGDVAARCGDDAEALASYDRAWQAGLRSCALALVLADLRARTGDEDGTLTLLAGTDHEGCRALDLFTASFARSRAPELAEAALRRLLGADSNDPDALSEQVRSQLAHDQAELTAEICARADALAHADLHEACALVASSTGAQHDAEHHFARAAELAPSRDHWLNLGRFLLAQRRQPEAADAFRAALGLAPGDYDATVDLGRALDPQCWDEARGTFRRAQAIAPERPEAWLRFGEMTAEIPCFSVDETRESHRALTRFVELARGRADLASLVEDVTRRCTREEMEHGRGSSRVAAVCTPGLLQSSERNCRGGAQQVDLQALWARTAGTTPRDCSAPRAP